MDDNFDLNEQTQLEPNDMPATPPLDQQPEIPQEPAPVPRKRRRRRKKRPTWQRLLWKYWPPIRFGLIILAGILLIWLAISAIGSVFSGPTEPDPSDPPVVTDPTDPPTDPPTEPPTEPPTQAPTDPPDPFAGAVADTWYENTLFIGDFNFGGLRDVARAGNADYFCNSYLGVYNWDEETSSDTRFEDQDLPTLLASKTYDKIIINVGINDCGYPVSSLIGAYSDLVTAVRDAQPNAKVILHGIMVVTKNYADDRDYFSPTHIASINEEIAAMADGVHVFYIDAHESFADTSGYLISSASTDGAHLTTAAYEDWAKLIGVALGKLGIE